MYLMIGIVKITFLGAAGTVTGSRYLIQSNSGQRILIDCGLFQGLKQLRLRNWAKFPIPPKTISAIILTHAHIDHSGYIPKLVQEGFEKEIYCTPATRALAEILLEDSAKLKEEEAEYANRKQFSKHKPALPLYTSEDVTNAMPLFRTKHLKETFVLGDFKIRFSYAGHILGAVSVLVECDGKSIFFSGDLGRSNDLLMKAPNPPLEADYIVMESTYGDRLHPTLDPIVEMKNLIKQVIERKSILLIPSFAVGRAQTLLYCIYKIFEQNPDLRIPLFVNSPMADKVTDLYRKFIDEHKLGDDVCRKICADATFIKSIEESKALNMQKGPMIIISASGMLTGGRILHHLQAFGEDPKNIILLVGFQAAGTRGYDLAHGEKMIKFFGYHHQINAEVENFDFLSAHADQRGLLDWLGSAKTKPRKVFLSHGEPHAADLLRRKIEEELKLETIVAEDNQLIEL